MAECGALDIFTQIQALVSDKLQVVSYKWLSRNFSVSSNYAKRLLQEFVDKHGNELEVIYTLSGWLKMNPQTYCIRLASGINLAEVKQEFEDNCSVQVYSVQACIPKDLAVLWSAEFVQAEELFNQPLNVENCLRDNRFCGVSNSFVKRNFHGKPVAAATPAQSKSVEGVVIAPQGKAGQTNGKHGIQSSTVVSLGDRSDKIATGVPDQPSIVNVVKESRTAVNNSKRKGQNEKASSGNGGSLANLWGRAAAKSKPSSPGLETSEVVQNVAITAEAQICAREAADAASSEEDGHDIKCKRESNGGRSRKRKVIIDFSDDDDDVENVVSLASPDPSSGHIPDSVNHGEKLDIEKRNLNFEEQKPDIIQVKQENIKENDPDLQLKVDTKIESKSTNIGSSLREISCSNVPGGAADKNRKTAPISAASTSPQRRKVLKTRIDERGREVTEVVWEGEAAAISASDKNMVTNDNGNSRPSVVNKVPAAGSNAPSNPVSKTGNKKTAKGGLKDAKQGNILSFFKKI